MKRVLIVDDSAFMRNMLKNSIKNTGLDFDIIGEASNGFEAIEKVKNLRPDIVTLDITMDKKNGLDTLKDIKNIDANTQVIMVSAMGQKMIILDAVNAGANDFIVKPFNQESIYNALVKL